MFNVYLQGSIFLGLIYMEKLQHLLSLNYRPSNNRILSPIIRKFFKNKRHIL